MKAELDRRQSLTDAVERVFRARPLEWIGITELAALGGVGGFRTRISELRRRKVDPMNLVNNRKNGPRSAYMWMPHAPLGRDAGTVESQRGLF